MYSGLDKNEKDLFTSEKPRADSCKYNMYSGLDKNEKDLFTSEKDGVASSFPPRWG